MPGVPGTVCPLRRPPAGVPGSGRTGAATANKLLSGSNGRDEATLPSPGIYVRRGTSNARGTRRGSHAGDQGAFRHRYPDDSARLAAAALHVRGRDRLRRCRHDVVVTLAQRGGRLGGAVAEHDSPAEGCRSWHHRLHQGRLGPRGLDGPAVRHLRRANRRQRAQATRVGRKGAGLVAGRHPDRLYVVCRSRWRVGHERGRLRQTARDARPRAGRSGSRGPPTASTSSSPALPSAAPTP